MGSTRRLGGCTSSSGRCRRADRRAGTRCPRGPSWAGEPSYAAARRHVMRARGVGACPRPRHRPAPPPA
jgi:hypothetical protein